MRDFHLNVLFGRQPLKDDLKMNFYLNLAKGGIVVGILFAAVQAPVIASESKTPLQKQTCPSLLNHDFMTLQGEKLEFCQFSGKVLLVVNTASYCGYTKQYAGLQTLFDRYKDRGLVVVGFPANDFGKQEPGTNTEVADFCERTFKVKFPMMAKSSVIAGNTNPLYAALASATGQRPKWNFHKYLIGRDGKPLGSYDSNVLPTGAPMVAQIEKALAAK